MTPSQRTRIRSLSRLGAVSLLSLGLIVAASVAPATASPGATPHGSAGGSYVAIGDSFTSGQGAAPYLPGPCLQSVSGSYPTITASSSSYGEALNFACSGATTSDVRAQIKAIDGRIRLNASLVTLTVGGIDAGSNEVLAACAPNPTPAACAGAVSAATANLMTVVGPNLVRTYVAVAKKFPKAHIVVLNYPKLFEPSLPGALAPILNGATEALNRVIAGAVAATNNPRVSLTDVTDEFAGHGIGSAVPYISFSTDLSDPANFHPNVLGNTAGYTAALLTDGAVQNH